MSLVIETDFQDLPFTMVPNHVATDARLSAEALGVLVWLSHFPRGYTVHRASILKRFKFGKNKWQRIRRELLAAGAIDPIKLVNPENGQRMGETFNARWPEQSRQNRTKSPDRPNSVPGQNSRKSPEPQNRPPGQNSRKSPEPQNRPPGAENRTHPRPKTGPLSNTKLAGEASPPREDDAPACKHDPKEQQRSQDYLAEMFPQALIGQQHRSATGADTDAATDTATGAPSSG